VLGMNVLVVDDEEKIVKIIKLYLEKEGFTVYVAYNGKTAYDLFLSTPLDLIILDLMLPDIDGETLCEMIRKSSSIPMMMLTAKVDEASIIHGLNIGADDYVIKPFSPKQLLARVHAILRRVKKDDESKVLRFNHNDLVIVPNTYEVWFKGDKVEFTPIEFKLLLAFTLNPKRIWTREDLITEVYGHDFDGYDRAIDSHIKNIRKKMDTNPPTFIKTVHGVGYKFGGEAND
jgi:DNA-binding response OmpR family regulator